MSSVMAAIRKMKYCIVVMLCLIASCYIFLTNYTRYTSESLQTESLLKEEIKSQKKKINNQNTLRFEYIQQYKAWITEHLRTLDGSHLVYSLVIRPKMKKLPAVSTPILKGEDIGPDLDVRRRLQQVVIEQQGIQEVSEDIFHHMICVEYLSLRWNKLKYLHSTSFDLLKNLTVLDIRNNELSALDMTSFNRLRVLEASNNPIRRITRLFLGENRNNAIFAFSNTAINSLQFCIKTPAPFTWRKNGYASVYVGFGHVIQCSCETELLQPFTIGPRCIWLEPELGDCVSQIWRDENGWICTNQELLADVRQQFYMIASKDNNP